MLFDLLLLVAPPPPNPPGVEMRVESRLLFLPPLPESADAARKDFRSTRAYLSQQRAELEQTLQRMRGSAEKLPLPSEFRMTVGNEAEVRYLISLLQDEQHARLLASFHETWNTWLTYIGSHRRSTPSPKSKTVLSPAPKQVQIDTDSLNKTLSRVDTPYKSGIRAGQMMAEVLNSARMDLSMPPPFHEIVGDPEDYANRKKLQDIVLRNAMAPSLAKSWVPLAEYLHGVAQQLADLDKNDPPDVDEDLKALRLQARLRFLERFQDALWMDDVVWSALADEDPPLPLKAKR